MAVNHTLIRNSENFKGLDRRSSDLVRSREYATDMLNAAFRKTGAINKRKGFKINIKDSNSFYGASSLKLVNALDGSVSEEIIAVDDKKAYKLLDYPFNIAYEGGSDVYLSIISEENAFKIIIKSQDSVLLEKSLGTGESLGDMTVQDLKSELSTLEFKIATIPSSANLGTITTIVPNQTFEYPLSIPHSNVTNKLALKVGEVVKINQETQPLNQLTITQVQTNYNINEEITSYDIVLTGNSYTLSNFATQGAGIALSLNEANDLSVNVSSAAFPLKAAFMDLVVDKRLEPASVGGVDIFVKTWQELEHGDTLINDGTLDENYFSWTIQDQNQIITDELENASFAQINNVMYISNGYTDLLKYDGEYVYSAGLPNASIKKDDNINNNYFRFTTTNTTSENQIADQDTLDDSQSDSNFKVEYKIQYEYTDYKGNIITSQPSESFAVNIAASQAVNIEWTLDDLDGELLFDSQNVFTGVNKGVLNNRDLRGIFNGNTTFSNGDVKIKHPQFDALPDTDTAPLQKEKNQKRLRVKVYRSKTYDAGPTAGGVVGQYYLVADVEYDHNVTVGTCSFTDQINDTDLNVFLALVEPIKRHDPPPRGKYLSIFKNCLVTAGDPTNVNNVRYSLPANASTGEIGSEYFPDDENGVVIDSPFGDKITAIAPLRDLLYVFHSSSISVMGGQINLLEQPVSELLTREGGIGCVSFHSIQEVKNTLFFLSEQGVYSINASNAVQEASSLINTLFVNPNVNKKRAVTVNWTSKDLIIMQIPSEDVVNEYQTNEEGEQELVQLTHTVEGSLIVVYDYYRDAWLKWDNIDMVASGIIYKNNLSFISRGKEGSTFSTMSTTDTRYDFTDHTDPIDFEYETNWESLGQPTIPKKFLRLKIFSFDTDGTFESPGFNLLTGVQKNYIDATLGEIDFDFDNYATAGWGIPPWGEFAWGNASSSFLKSKLISGKTTSLKLKFANNTQNENILITTYEMEIASPYGMEIKD